MVYYLQQNVAVLSQISQQISFIAPQFSIPSTPPPPFPAFNPSASDVRVNAFWFMALIFSLSAALLATLVQQWVRDYMHIFRRYGDPLKSARIRQYLYEGCEGWYMPVVAEAVPGLLHVSLFLFFVGLGDTVLRINTTVGLSTTIPIGISGFLYIFTIFAPVIYPQSPYQNAISGLIWYTIQKLRGRRFKDRDGNLKSVSTNMTQGQMQLAMEATEDREGRDARAIWWLVDSMTEDAEMESFVLAMPGSFNEEWGAKVWKRISEITSDENGTADWNGFATGPPTDTNLHIVMPIVTRPSIQTPIGVFSNLPSSIVRLFRTRNASRSPTNTMVQLPSQDSPDSHLPVVATSTHRRNVVRELSRRMAHTFETCGNRGIFSSDELWRRRTRACVEVTTSLVCYADAELGWYGDILRPLGNIGGHERIRELSSAGMDQSFVIRWTCLSIMAIRPMLSDNKLLMEDARLAVVSFGEFQGGDGTDEVAEKNAQEIDAVLDNAWRCVLSDFCQSWDTRGIPVCRKIVEFLGEQGAQTPNPDVFENAELLFDILQSIDSRISVLQERMNEQSHRITRLLPGVQSDVPLSAAIFLQTLELHNNIPEPRFIFPQVAFRRFFVLHNDYTHRFGVPLLDQDYEKVLFWQKSLSQRQLLWRLQDLRDGGGLGFTVELFLLVLRQLLSLYPSQRPHSAMYIRTFRATTSDWSKYKHSLGTQRILLATLTSSHGIVHQFNYPTYITDELWVLLDNILEGQTGAHIDNAVQQLTDHQYLDGYKYGAKALAIISRLRASRSSS
jgi:hypothetical protein